VLIGAAVVLFLLRYWWLGVPVAAIPACLAIMHGAGLKFGRATCLDCGTKRWMLRTGSEYRCDACVQKQAEAAAVEFQLFDEWSWRPYMSGKKAPDSYEPEPPHSGFSTQHPLPFSDRIEASPPQPSSQCRTTGRWDS
jgi:hypothetical protein